MCSWRKPMKAMRTGMVSTLSEAVVVIVVRVGRICGEERAFARGGVGSIPTAHAGPDDAVYLARGGHVRIAKVHARGLDGGLAGRAAQCLDRRIHLVDRLLRHLGGERREVGH